MGFSMQLESFRALKSLLSLIAIILIFIIIFVSVWLWFDYKMAQLSRQGEQSPNKELPNF